MSLPSLKRSTRVSFSAMVEPRESVTDHGKTERHFGFDSEVRILIEWNIRDSIHLYHEKRDHEGLFSHGAYETRTPPVLRTFPEFPGMCSRSPFPFPRRYPPACAWSDRGKLHTHLGLYPLWGKRNSRGVPFFHGAYETRTRDPNTASVVRSQLR